MSGQPLVDPDRSPLLRTLYAVLPAIQARLLDAEAWQGLQVQEPTTGATYLRLVCKDELLWRGQPLVVGVHAFERGAHRGHLHDHRWPLAVWPFGLDPANRAEPLYDMPWQHQRGGTVLASGSLAVHHGQPWAIEDHVGVLHAVHSRQPHASLNITDVRQAPARRNRMDVAALEPSRTEALRRRCVAELAAHAADTGAAAAPRRGRPPANR